MDRLTLLMTTWTHAHPIMGTSLVWVIALISLVSLVFNVRWFLRRFQQTRQAEETQQQRERWRDHRTGAMIRHAEEWCVDASTLRILWDREKFSKYLHAQSQRYADTALLPMAVFVFLAMLSLPFPFHHTTTFTNGLTVSAVLSLGWWTWSYVQVFRLTRMAKRVALLPMEHADGHQE